jgi:hypothetical protein
MVTASAAVADQGGIGFWLPGQYGSFVAVAPSPGWLLPNLYYHYTGSAGSDHPLPRGYFLATGLNGSFDGLLVVPTYTFDTTILGARPSFSMAFMPAYSSSSADIRIGPLSGSRSVSAFGVGDLYPAMKLYWTADVHNFMVYATGDISTGDYSADRLSNIGIGHGAIDGGGAYTYLNTKSGTEASATLEFTENFENAATHYTNGVDAHLDLGASQFLSKNFFGGIVGFYYQQLTADKGQPASLYLLNPRVGKPANGR